MLGFVTSVDFGVVAEISGSGVTGVFGTICVVVGVFSELVVGVSNTGLVATGVTGDAVFRVTDSGVRLVSVKYVDPGVEIVLDKLSASFRVTCGFI